MDGETVRRLDGRIDDLADRVGWLETPWRGCGR